MPFRDMTLRERFDEKVDKTGGPDACWVWTATKNNQGYGMLQMQVRGQNGKRLAHRVSYILHRGRIRHSACVLHRCDNPACVNPKHLFLGSYKDNYDDMVSKGRRRNVWPGHLPGGSTFIPEPPRGDDHWTRKHPERVQRGSENGFAKLTEKDVRQIYSLRLKGQKAEHIAKRFDLDPSTVGDILKGTHWRHMLGTKGCPTLKQLKAIKTARAPSKLTTEQATEIKRRIKKGEPIKPLAREFGIAFQTVSDIKRGKSWAFITV